MMWLMHSPIGLARGCFAKRFANSLLKRKCLNPELNVVLWSYVGSWFGRA